MAAEQEAFTKVVDNQISFEVKGKLYRLANLTLRDWGEFCEFVKFQPYYKARKHGASREELREILDECVKGKNYNVNSPEILQFAGTLEGFFKLFEISLRRTATPEKDIQLLLQESDEEIFVDVAPRFFDLIGFISKSDEENPQTPNP